MRLATTLRDIPLHSRCRFHTGGQEMIAALHTQRHATAERQCYAGSDFSCWSGKQWVNLIWFPLNWNAKFCFGNSHPLSWQRASRVAQWERICLPMQETQVQFLGWEDSLGEEMGNPFQYSCLGNPMDRGAWWAIVHGVAKSWTWPRDWVPSLQDSYLIWIIKESYKTMHWDGRNVKNPYSPVKLIYNFSVWDKNPMKWS